jgi:hypothetical protein
MYLSNINTFKKQGLIYGWRQKYDNGNDDK